eukprot:m.68178 g.68178  ORF g.68178 m.68178 type:complete len:695 (+) comp12188_c0_seq1:205-2289(+)
MDTHPPKRKQHKATDSGTTVATVNPIHGPRSKGPKGGRGGKGSQRCFLAGLHLALAHGSYDSLAHAKRRIKVVEQAGGAASLTASDQTTVVLCGETATKDVVINRITTKGDLSACLPPPSASYVRVSWLTQCLKAKALVDVDSYQLPASAACISPSKLPASLERDLSGEERRHQQQQQQQVCSSPSTSYRDRECESDGDTSVNAGTSTGVGTPASSLRQSHGLTAKTNLLAVLDETSTVREVPCSQDQPAITKALGTNGLSNAFCMHTRAKYTQAAPSDANDSQSIPVIIDLPPELQREYMCYNCGDRTHGAAECTAPLRGTGGNTFVPPFRGAKSTIAREWICARAHTLDVPGAKKQKEADKPNANIVAHLERLHDTYADYTGSLVHAMKANQLSKALTFIRQLKTEITSFEEARRIPNVGKETALKIEEIINTGELARLAAFDTPEKQAQHEFSQLYGVGATTAKQLVAKGFLTIDDLKRNKHELTDNQRIGLALHDELRQRIPRKEVTEMVQFFKRVLREISPEAVVEVCGSYRRGKQMCGDVDFLVSHRDPDVRSSLFDELLGRLKAQEFLTHDLVTSTRESTQEKYMGIGKLPWTQVHRRIDIIIVPWEEIPCALLYFTGSGHFNRSMRLLARKCGWSLSQHSFNIGVVRDRKDKAKKLGDGIMIPMKSEQDVFAVLGLEYQPPSKRNA